MLNSVKCFCGDDYVDDKKISDKLFNFVISKKNELEKLKYDYFSGENGVLLYLLDNNGVSQSNISEFLGVSLPRVAFIIRNLENNDLIIRAVDYDDKRKTVIIITEKGKKYINQKRESLLDTIDKLLNELTLEEIDNYIKISNKINNILKENKYEGIDQIF